LDVKKLILACVALILASFLAVCGLAGCRSRPDGETSKSSGQTLYVSNASDCDDQHPCYASIQGAVDAASEGDVIKVALGTYTTTASQVVTIKKGIRLVGGYHVDDWSVSRADVQPAIIDAEQAPGRRGVSIDGRGVSTITLKGFWIRRGGAQASGGGGVHVAGGSVVLEDNVIEACTAETRGGGLFIAGGSVHMRNNTLEGNVAQYGGGLYIDDGRVVLEQNTFLNNAAPPIGGALAIAGGVVTGVNDVVADNARAGTGVYLSGGHLTASHWTVVNNGRYGIIADLGIDIKNGSATLRKSIIASHTGGLCGAGAAAQQALFYDVDRPCIAGASCVNNLFGDPKFVDPSAGDYHIAADSAAVDRGYSLDVFYDMDGDIRPVGAASDIGADEIEPYTTYLPLVVRRRGWQRP